MLYPWSRYCSSRVTAACCGSICNAVNQQHMCSSSSKVGIWHSEPVVGSTREEFPETSVTFVDNVKRLMGKAFDDLLGSQCGYQVEATSDGKVGIRCKPTGQIVTAPQVAAEILKVQPHHAQLSFAVTSVLLSMECMQVLKARAQTFLAEEVDRAVITVPSHYTNDQRLATMEAAALSGIARVSLLQVCISMYDCSCTAVSSPLESAQLCRMLLSVVDMLLSHHNKSIVERRGCTGTCGSSNGPWAGKAMAGGTSHPSGGRWRRHVRYQPATEL